MSATLAQPSPPRLLDERYELGERVGIGGMAAVYRGRDRRLGGREVAIKVLHAHLSERPDSRQRFKNEADSSARLVHPNILKVYDASDADSPQSYIVMEFVHGRTLSRLVEEHPFRVPELGVLIAHEIALAVSHAHRARILHRDIKPENVMLSDDGVVKLMDFGIARALDQSHLTVTGAMMGSPAHMAPEQIEGKPIDFRADVFSLGTVLYYLVTGVLPFTAPSPHAVLKRILAGDYEPAQRMRPAVGRELSAIIDKALANKPEDRFATADALLDALAEFLGQSDITTPARELVAWNLDPDSYEQQLAERVIKAQLDRARRAARLHQRATALEALNRVLSLDENQEEASALLAALTRASDHRKLAWAAALVVIIAAMATTTWWLWPPAPSARPERLAPQVSRAFIPAPVVQALLRPKMPPPLAVELAPIARRSQGHETQQMRRPTEADVPIPSPKVIRPLNTNALSTSTGVQPAAHVGTVEVTIFAYPQPVQVEVDGAAVTGIPRKTHLAPGKHTVVLEHPSCAPCLRTAHAIDVRPGIPEQSFRLAIELKPAVLVVDANVAATVYVGQRQLGQTGKRLEIDIDTPDGGVHRVRVEAPGREPEERDVRLAPGETAHIAVSLKTQAPF